MGDPGIYPRRFGLKYAPVPIFAMEYSDSPRPETDDEEDHAKLRLFEVPIPEISKQSTDPQSIFEKLRQDHPQYINPGIVSISQVKRLVKKLYEEVHGIAEEEKVQKNEQNAAPSSNAPPPDHSHQSENQGFPQDLPKHSPRDSQARSREPTEDELAEEIESGSDYGGSVSFAESEPDAAHAPKPNGLSNLPEKAQQNFEAPLSSESRGPPESQSRDVREASFSSFDEEGNDAAPQERAPADNPASALPAVNKPKRSGLLGALPSLGGGGAGGMNRARQLGSLGDSEEEEEDFANPMMGGAKLSSLSDEQSNPTSARSHDQGDPLPIEKPNQDRNEFSPPTNESAEIDESFDEDIAEDSHVESFGSDDGDFIQRGKAEAEAKKALEQESVSQGDKEPNRSAPETDDEDDYGDETFVEEEESHRKMEDSNGSRPVSGMAPDPLLDRPRAGGLLGGLPGLPGMGGKGGGKELPALGGNRLSSLSSGNDGPDPFKQADDLGFSNSSVNFDMDAASPARNTNTQQPPEPEQGGVDKEPEKPAASDTGFGGGFGGSTNWMGGDNDKNTNNSAEDAYDFGSDGSINSDIDIDIEDDVSAGNNSSGSGW